MDEVLGTHKSAGRATVLVRAVDEILGTHKIIAYAEAVTAAAHWYTRTYTITGN